MSALAFANRDLGEINAIPPLIGTAGSVAFFVMLTWYLYAQLPSVFWLVVLVAAAVFTVEAITLSANRSPRGYVRPNDSSENGRTSLRAQLRDPFQNEAVLGAFDEPADSPRWRPTGTTPRCGSRRAY